MAALIRFAIVAALTACVSKPAPPPEKGAARSWHERADHPAPGAVQPGQLQAPRLFYDPRRERVMLYGGHPNGLDGSDTMFELDPASGWRLICTKCLANASPAGAGGRDVPAIVYDPINARILLFGGDHLGLEYFNELWALYSDEWTLVPPNGGDIPSKRSQNQMVFDPTKRKLWLLGGYADSNPFSDTYFLDEQGVWSAAPEPTMNVIMASPGVDSVYDPQRERILLLENAQLASSELWEYVSNHWNMISEHASTDRNDAVLVHIPDYDQTFLIGGYRDSNHSDPANFIAGTEVLVGDHFETYDASLPPARVAPGIAYDVSRDVVVLYGGEGSENDPDCNSNHDCEGTWELRRDAP